jgi:hypothetical protein
MTVVVLDAVVSVTLMIKSSSRRVMMKAQPNCKGVKSMLDSCYGDRAPLRPRARGNITKMAR